MSAFLPVLSLVFVSIAPSAQLGLFVLLRSFLVLSFAPGLWFPRTQNLKSRKSSNSMEGSNLQVSRQASNMRTDEYISASGGFIDLDQECLYRVAVFQSITPRQIILCLL